MAVDHNNPQSRNEEILIATIDGNEYNKAPQSRMEELLLELKETIEEGGGGGGTSDYESLSNQPQVNGETLIGNKTGADLGLVDSVEGKGLSTNDYDDNEKSAVAAATSAISAIKDGVDIDSFGDVEVALLDKADISDLGTAAAKNSTNAVTAGSTDLVESGAVKDAIDVAVAAAYHHAGTKTVAQLTHDLLIAANEGNVYNITDSGTTTSDFIEGIGKTIDEGSNVGICKVGNAYMFDLLSGFVDTTNFVQKSQTSGLLKNDGTVNDEIEGDVSTLKSGLTNLDNEVNGSATTYSYADVITIEDAVPANLADCSVKVEPVQDLHGYDKPWVGGAGKNKLPLTTAKLKADNYSGTWNGNVYSYRGIDFTITEDNAGNVIEIDVNGTAVADYAKLDILNASITQGSYKLNGISGGSQTTLCFDLAGIGDYKTLSDGELSVDASTDAEYTFSVNVRTSGTTVSHQKVYPMIRLATETDSTFAPYTNICPISGHTEAVVMRDGKNLAKNNMSTTTQAGVTWTKNSDGSITVSGTPTGNTYVTRAFVAKVKSSMGKVTFSGLNGVTNITCEGLFLHDTNGNNITSWSTGASDLTVDLSSYDAADFITASFKRISNNVACSGTIKPQIEVGETATEFEPYKCKQYTLALGDTIYGGTVDFETGVMTVDRVKFTKNTSTMNNDSPNYPGWKGAGIKQYIGNNVTGASLTNTNVGFGYGYETRYNSDIVDLPLDLYGKTQDEWKALAIDVEFIVELATPTTIQLTPQQIQLLQGTNTLYASTGDISVSVNGVSGAIGAVQEQANATDNALAQLAADIAEQLPDAPTTDGAYVLTVTVADGAATYSWESAE